MPTRGVRAVTTAALACALAVVGGCSGTDGPDASLPEAASSSTAPSTSATAQPAVPTQGQVFRELRTAALAAESGRIEGDLERAGSTFELEVEGNAGGSNQQLFLTVEDGGRAEVLTVGDDYWLGGDEAFWTEQTGDAAAGAEMVGRYVPITESDAKELGSFTLRTILTEMLSLPEVAALEGSQDPVGTDTVDGVEAYVLSGEDGAQLWVVADGSAALLRLVGPTSAPAHLDFDEWGRAPTLIAPAPADVVDEG